MRLVTLLAVSLLLSGCGVPTYVRPAGPNPAASEPVRATKAQILDAAVNVLVQDGYQVTVVDHSSGLVSTAPQSRPVTPAQADCGRVKGLIASGDPLTYPQPRTRVAFDIIARDDQIVVRSRIDDHLDSETLPTDLTCVSRGVLERDMLEQIAAHLKQ